MGVDSIEYPYKDLPLTNRVTVNETDVAAVKVGTATKTIEAHTGDDTLTTAESGSVHSNLGATGTITLTLPASAAAGIMFTFACQSAQFFRIDPGTATIRDFAGQTPDKYKWCDTIGDCLTLVADLNGDWVTIGKEGVWQEQE